MSMSKPKGDHPNSRLDTYVWYAFVFMCISSVVLLSVYAASMRSHLRETAEEYRVATQRLNEVAREASFRLCLCRQVKEKGKAIANTMDYCSEPKNLRPIYEDVVGSAVSFNQINKEIWKDKDPSPRSKPTPK